MAESVLADLGLTDKVYAYAEPVLWFPSGTYPDDVGNTGQDSLWQADLDEAEAGYVYTFLNEVGGLGVNFYIRRENERLHIRRPGGGICSGVQG